MNAKRTNSTDNFMNEYVAWGGPIVTRFEAYQDCIARGMTAREADISAFGRKAVEAPENPAVHLAFLRQIQLSEGMLQAVAA